MPNIFRVAKLCGMENKNLQYYSRGSNGSESFLTSSIPDLKLHAHIVDCYSSNFEIHTNSCDIIS